MSIIESTLSVLHPNYAVGALYLMGEVALSLISIVLSTIILFSRSNGLVLALMGYFLIFAHIMIFLGICGMLVGVVFFLKNVVGKDDDKRLGTIAWVVDGVVIGYYVLVGTIRVIISIVIVATFSSAPNYQYSIGILMMSIFSPAFAICVVIGIVLFGVWYKQSKYQAV
jgi:hypothetical protein